MQQIETEKHWSMELFDKLSNDMTEQEKRFLKSIFESIYNQYTNLNLQDFITIMEEDVSNPIFPTLNTYGIKRFLFDDELDRSAFSIHACIPTSLKEENHLSGTKSIYTAGVWNIRMNDNQGSEIIYRGDFGDRRSIHDAIQLASSLKQQFEFFEAWLRAKFED